MRQPKYTPHPGLALLVIVALAVCWLPAVNGLGEAWTSGSIYSVSAIYGTSRGINALVSVLQGTTIDFPMVNIALGEVLDPVNDLIERFSGVVTVALGALILQKVLFELVATPAFNSVVTGLGVLTLLASAWHRPRLCALLIRLFFIAVFVRLSLSMVFLLTASLDSVLLEQTDSEHHADMQAYQASLRGLNMMVNSKPPLQPESDRLLDRLGALGADRVALQQRLEQVQLDTTFAENTVAALKQRRARFAPPGADEKQALEELHALQQDAAEIKQSLQQIDDEVNAVYQQMDNAGLSENPGAWTTADIGKLFAWKQLVNNQLEQMQDSLNGFVDSAITLLVSILLKSLLMPLFFFYLLLWGARAIWAYEHTLHPELPA